MNALILFSYANIESIDDIEPFYHHLFHGNVKQASLQRGQRMFKSLGVRDPLASNTRRVGEGITKRLQEATGEDWNFYVGNKHIDPFVEDAVTRCLKDGAKRIFTLSLTPFHSRTGTEVYQHQVMKSLEKQGKSNIPVTHVSPFYNHEGFINVLSQRLNDAIHWLPQSIKKETEVIFTAHSMPGTPKAHASFIDQYETLAKQLMQTTTIGQYHLAYRSGGAHPQKWLEPDISDVISSIADKDGKAIVVCELLSIIANAEAIQELGYEAKTLAHNLDMEYVQTEYLNDSDDFITTLYNHILNEI